MSFNAPTDPALDRSSVTPPTSVQRPVGPRMKPQSERYKRLQREAHPKVVQRAREYAEEQKRCSRNADNPRTQPVWMDLDSDDAGAGPLDKDDAVYQGRSVRSRIASVQAARDGVIQTRGGTARDSASGGAHQPATAREPEARTPAGNDGPGDHTSAPEGARSKGRKKKAYKTPALVISSDSEELESAGLDEHTLGKRRREEALEAMRAERKKHRTTRPAYDWPMLRTPPPPSPPRPRLPSVPPPPVLGPEPELPSLLEIMNNNRGSLTGNELFDEEAQESEGERRGESVELSDDGERGAFNGYDLDDPFINDAEETDGSESSCASLASKHRSSKSSLSSPFKPKAKPARPPSEDDFSSDSDDSRDGDGEVVLKRLSRTKTSVLREPTPVPSYETVWVPATPSPSNVVTAARPKPRSVPKKTAAVALTVTPPADPRPCSAPQSNPADGPRGSLAGTRSTKVATDSTERTIKKDKGKGRAQEVPSEDVDPETHEDDLGADLSEMNEWERTQFELAILNSKRGSATNTQGESSSQGSSSMSTPRATALFTSASPALSTPQATALFTAPSTGTSLPLPPPNQSPVSPLGSTPALSMAELVRRSRAAAANTPADTTTPSVDSPPSTPSGPSIVLIIRVTEADLPLVDETLNAALQDIVLANHYVGLVRLRAGHFEPWGHIPGPGFIMFEAWGDQCPRMNALIALAAVNFMECGVYRNPCRSSPVGIGLYAVPGQKDRFNFYCAGSDPQPLLAVTTGMLEDSQLTVPSETGLRQKWVRVIMHSQEAQRYMGYVRMVTGREFLYAQYNKHALQFSTRPMLRSPNNPNNRNKEQSRKDNGKGLRVDASKMFAAPSSSTGAGNRVSADNFSLPAEATVPVYDARRVPTFDFNSNISRLADTLPLWTGGEIPYGSFVMVGHTLTLYRSQAGNWTVGCNLQWVVLVGNPDDD